MGASFDFAYAKIKLEMKKKSTAKTEPLHIVYGSYSFPGGYLGYLFAIFMVTIVFPLLFMQIAYIGNPHDFFLLNYGFQAMLFFVFMFFVIAVVVYFMARKEDSELEDPYQRIREKWQPVTGKIIGIDCAARGRPGAINQLNYYLIIEYKKPGETKSRKYTTPRLRDNPHLEERDLPLDVRLYVRGNKVYADEIINPPIQKIVARERHGLVVFWSFIIGLVITLPLVCFKQFAAADAVMICTIVITIVIALWKVKEE